MESTPIFGNKKKLLIGMIHIPALPGTPFNTLSPKEIINKCVQDALTYKKCGIDSVMIENMNDIPYLKRNVGPEITSLMSIIAYEISNIFSVDNSDSESIPLGVQILAGANKEALSVAYNANYQYIRAEGFVFSHVADEGTFESDAGELLRYRKLLNANHIKVFTDIKKKHSSHSITGDLSIGEMAANAKFFGTDGVIVTGSSTGAEASVEDLEDVRNKCPGLHIIIGSGISNENIGKYIKYADGFIVGSYFKVDGNWRNEVDYNRVKEFVGIFNSLR